MTCQQDDTNFMGPVSLFIGVETAKWSLANFRQAAQFAKAHKIDTLIVKCSEVTSTAGDIWYGGLDYVRAIAQAIKGEGVNFLSYQFVWGDTFGELSTEIGVCQQFLDTFGCHCLDLEDTSWSGGRGAAWATKMAESLKGGKLFLSMPADPISMGQQDTFTALAPITSVFMPMVYTDYLDTTWEQQIKQIAPYACVMPTLDLSGDFGPNDPAKIAARMCSIHVPCISIWEYGPATATPSLLDTVVQAFYTVVPPTKGEPTVPLLHLNAQGCVLDIVKSYQLENGESQDLCGPWSVASLLYAGLPGRGPRGSAEDLDKWADSEANKYMTQGQFNWPGTTIQQMYDFMRDAIDPQSHQRALHWWDMPTSDVAHITKAVQAGYPVLITANEQNIIEKRTGARPYPWNLDATHVLPVVGIDKDGDFICADELNNNFQGYWPVVYLAQRINPIWATTVQVVGPDQNNPWLKPIPSADPTTWPSDFIAQTFGGAVQQTTPTDHVKQAFDTEWSSVVSGLDPNTGIAKAALVDYRAGNSHGPALTKEFKLNDWQGNVLTAQMLCSGVYMWDGQAHWHPFK